MIYRVRKEIIKLTGIGTMFEKETVMSSSIDYMSFRRELDMNKEYYPYGSCTDDIPNQCYMKIIPLEIIENSDTE